MNRREPTVFSTGSSRNVHSLRSILLAVLTWLSILFLLYKAFLWWEVQRKPIPQSLQQGTVVAPLANTKPQEAIALPPRTYRHLEQSPLAFDSSTTDKRTVRKCVVDGHISFTDRPCPNGAITSSVTVSTANVGTIAPIAPIAPPEPVMQIRQQVVIAQVPNTQAQSSFATKQVECAYFEMEIKRIDEAARQPQSGQAQDVLSEERKKVRSRQFALHC